MPPYPPHPQGDKMATDTTIIKLRTIHKFACQESVGVSFDLTLQPGGIRLRAWNGGPTFNSLFTWDELQGAARDKIMNRITDTFKAVRNAGKPHAAT